jgi:hypothetical protein
MRTDSITASISRLDLPRVVGEILLQLEAVVEGQHRRLALLADHQRLDHRADFVDLRQNALHVIVGLHRNHHGNGLKRHIHVNVLLFAVVQQVEVLGLQTVQVVAVPVQHRDRRQHHVDAGADRLLAFGNVRGRILSANQQGAGSREQHNKSKSSTHHIFSDVTAIRCVPSKPHARFCRLATPACAVPIPR